EFLFHHQKENPQNTAITHYLKYRISIFVPLALELGFSPMATIALVGTAAALGDAGSPTSDSTLGPTAGLNVDGGHNHIWDTCVPTFVHYNLPLIL
ncbi:Na+/H+ antiporter NhaC family protein, partial [Robertmurraya sp. DFI.2.37]|uniref:Na+/H+ antiporter NhaC family protein n=1 Tax=Robertmurraya sp. DFI.2.37 TaxID=3031819 RepID=UPI0023DCAE24